MLFQQCKPSPKSNSNWDPSVQLYKTMRAISRPNHHTEHPYSWKSSVIWRLERKVGGKWLPSRAWTQCYFWFKWIRQDISGLQSLYGGFFWLSRLEAMTYSSQVIWTMALLWGTGEVLCKYVFSPWAQSLQGPQYFRLREIAKLPVLIDAPSQPPASIYPESGMVWWKLHLNSPPPSLSLNLASSYFIQRCLGLHLPTI